MKILLKIVGACLVVFLALAAFIAIDQQRRPEHYAELEAKRQKEEQQKRLAEIDARLKREAQAAAHRKAEEDRLPKLTAGELLDEYSANEIAADRRYKGNKIRVSGYIASIGKDILGSPYVTLTDDGRSAIRSVQAMYSKSDEAILGMLSKGQKYTVTCICSGLMLNVILRCGS